uniref:Uncharacterized protein n=1 Tax=Fervidicoccus fontis TaxID=683846 RepID=A0A7C1IJ89_9CREN
MPVREVAIVLFLVVVALAALLAYMHVSSQQQPSSSSTYTAPPLEAGSTASPAPSEPPYQPPSSTTKPFESVVASRLCPVHSSTAELKAQANVITDENLLSLIEKEVEKYVENLRSRNMTIPEETLQLLEALKNRRGDVALLEVVVEVRNRGPEAISISGGAPCGPIIDFIASNATGRERAGEIEFALVTVTPIEGSVYVGEPTLCILALFMMSLSPGQSLQSTHYYIIKKPSPDRSFEAKISIQIKGFIDTLCVSPTPKEPCDCAITLEVIF